MAEKYHVEREAQDRYAAASHAKAAAAQVWWGCRVFGLRKEEPGRGLVLSVGVSRYHLPSACSLLVLRVSGSLPRPHLSPLVALQASGKFDREIVPVKVAQKDASGGCCL